MKYSLAIFHNGVPCHNKNCNPITCCAGFHYVFCINDTTAVCRCSRLSTSQLANVRACLITTQPQTQFRNGPRRTSYVPPLITILLFNVSTTRVHECFSPIQKAGDLTCLYSTNILKLLTQINLTLFIPASDFTEWSERKIIKNRFKILC